MSLSLVILAILSNGAAARKRVVLHTDVSMNVDAPGADCIYYDQGQTTWVNGSCVRPRDVDDAWFIPLVLMDTSIDLVGIVVQYGNGWCYNPVEESCDRTSCPNVDKMVELVESFVFASGKDIPVVRGSLCPFNETLEAPSGTQKMIDLLKETGPATVLSAGTASDVAYMLRDLDATNQLDLLDGLVLEMGNVAWQPWPALDQGFDANSVNDQGAVQYLVNTVERLKQEKGDVPFETNFVPGVVVRMGVVTPALLSGLQAREPDSIAFKMGTDSAKWLNYQASNHDTGFFQLWDVVLVSSILSGSTFSRINCSAEVQTFKHDFTGREILELELTNSSSKTGFTCITEILGFGPPLLPAYTKAQYYQEDLTQNDLNVIPQLAQMGIDRLDQAKQARTPVPVRRGISGSAVPSGLHNVTYDVGNLRGNMKNALRSAYPGN